MRYYVYCDGAYSVERGVGAWSFLIFTNVRYIFWGSNKTRFITTPTYAEDVAMGMACHWLANNSVLMKNDIITIYSDSLATIDFMKSIIDSGKSFKFNDKLVDDAIQNIRKLSTMCTVEFIKVHGHRKKLSPNKCVDRHAKHFLRS
jgi:ribonuclease HI